MKKTILLIIALTLLGITAPTTAHALTPILSATVGTGANLSYFVLDFGQSNPSYAFAYRYDGIKTGGGLIDALAGANIGFTDTSKYFPLFNARIFYTFSYNGTVINPPANGYWQYWISGNGTQWTSPATYGADGDSLVSGSYSAFGINNGVTDIAPRTPVAAPESGTALLTLTGVGIAAVSLARRWRPA